MGEYGQIWMPLKSAVPSTRPTFVEISIIDKCLALCQNGVQLQSYLQSPSILWLVEIRKLAV